MLSTLWPAPLGRSPWHRLVRVVLILSLLLIVALPGMAATPQAQVPDDSSSIDAPPAFAPGVVLVGLKPDTGAAALSTLPAEGGGGSDVQPLTAFGSLEPLLPRSSRPALSAQADPASPRARLGRIHRLHLPPGE